MTFSDILIKECTVILKKNLTHPFVTSLINGSLDKEKFRYYMVQDMLYIADYARAMTWVAPQMADISDIMRMLNAARETFEIESLLKEEYFAQFEIAVEDARGANQAPSCKAYIDHLFRYTRNGTLAEGLAAILPCSWIYVEIGLHYNSGDNTPDSNPYKMWLQTYSDPTFVDMVDWWFSIINSITVRSDDKELNHLKNIFVDSCRYEWLFWEMSWNMEPWQPL